MGVVLMLMTIGGLICAAILLVISYFTKKIWLRTFVLGGVFVWFVSYTLLLLVSSIFSEEKTLSFNQPKEFYGFYFDCHMHAAVTGVRKTKTLGDRTANGDFYIVKVKVSSDAKQATLGLITVDAHVVDDQNREFKRDKQAETQLGEQPPFDRKILPVESFEKEIVFDLSADIKNPRLDIREGYGIDHIIEAVLVGDEDSILHKRNYFKLETNEQLTGN
ncbi:MAG: hypothetical protein H0V31_12390 [Acidobacteria bacterium]|nr:hypothetical protein [Acidobacteriota bacterium]